MIGFSINNEHSTASSNANDIEIYIAMESEENSRNSDSSNYERTKQTGEYNKTSHD